MNPRQQRAKIAVVSLFLLVVPLASMYFHGKNDRQQSLMESMLIRLTSPGQDLTYTLFHNVVGAWHRYVYLVEVEKQNEEIRDKLNDLKLMASRAQGLEEEAKRLRAMLEFKQTHTELDLLSGRVIGRENSPYFSVSKLRLERGEADEVRTNMPVVTASGIIGRIEAVSGDYCDVMLLSDTRSRADVQVSGKGVNGIVLGTGDGPPTFRYPYQKARLSKGDLLITTGHDRIFPTGLVVGYLASDEPKQVGQQLEIEVDLAVNFSAVQEAFIVTRQRAHNLENATTIEEVTP